MRLSNDLAEPAKHSLHPFLLVFSNFSFTGIDYFVDVYSISAFDPMHVSYLGISKLLQEFLVSAPSDPTRTTRALKIKSASSRTFRAAKSYVLRSVNGFLRRTAWASPRPGLHIGFSQNGAASPYSGLFSEQGVAGMLEAKDFGNVDKNCPFLGAIVHAYCASSNAKGT